MRRLFSILVISLMLSSCARRAPQPKVDILIAPQDLTAPVRGKDCDAARSILHCKLFIVKYKQGSEQVEVKK